MKTQSKHNTGFYVKQLRDTTACPFSELADERYALIAALRVVEDEIARRQGTASPAQLGQVGKSRNVFAR